MWTLNNQRGVMHLDEMLPGPGAEFHHQFNAVANWLLAVKSALSLTKIDISRTARTIAMQRAAA